MFAQHRRACAMALSALLLTACGGRPSEPQNQIPGVSARTDTFGTSIGHMEPSTTVNVFTTKTSNSPPVVIVDGDRIVPRRSLVTLGAWGFDPEGTEITVAWEQTEGPAVTLSNSDTLSPSFHAPADAARLRFLVRASDGELTSEPAAVVVDVRNFAPYVGPVTLSPNAPRTADDIVVDAQQFDADNDALTATYQWDRNGTLVGSQTSATFPANLTTKNDVIKVRITVSDGFESSVAEASTTILDSPPVLTTQPQPPTALNYGDTARFTVTASDADDDPVDLEVAHGPAGFSIDSAGEVTWTAAGPLFDRVTEFNWGVRVRGDASSLMTGTFEVTDADRLYPLRRGALQIPAQNSGLQIGDFDANGSPEILVAGTRGVYELSRNGSTYQQSWAYPFEVDSSDIYYNRMHALAARDLDGDGAHEIFFSKGTVLIKLDGEDRREAARAEHPCYALEFADLDGDGDTELVCLEGLGVSSPMQVTVLDPATLAVIWSSARFELGISMAIGNVDGDAALEIVTNGGYVFDGQSQQIQWKYTQPFGLAVDAGDLDGDGVEEIVGIVDWSAVRTYSAVSLSPLWEYTPSWNDLDAVHVADTDGDGRVEVIAANGQGGYVMGLGFNAAQGQLELLWQVESQDSGVTSIAVGNVDADSTPEVVWGVGANSSGRDDFVIAGFSPAISIEWQSSSQPYPDGPFYGAALARIGGGASRLMFMTPRSESSYGGMRALALDPATGTFEFSRDLGSNWLSSRAFEVVDVDNDSVDELVVGSSTNSRFGYFSIYDFASDSIEWQSPQTGRSESPIAMTHSDVNGDGYQELISLTSNGYIYVYDVHAQSLLWKSALLGGSGIDIQAADLDGDGDSELVVATSARIVIYGESLLGSAFVERASLQATDIADVLVSDLDGNDVPEIYALRSPFNSPATVNIYDSGLQPTRSVPLGVQANRVFVEDSSFHRKNLLIGTGPSYSTSTEIWAIDPVTGADVWRSPMLVGQIAHNGLRYVDVDADGDEEISFGTFDGMYVTR
jgi:hypothetical protein